MSTHLYVCLLSRHLIQTLYAESSGVGTEIFIRFGKSKPNTSRLSTIYVYRISRCTVFLFNIVTVKITTPSLPNSNVEECDSIQHLNRMSANENRKWCLLLSSATDYPCCFSITVQRRLYVTRLLHSILFLPSFLPSFLSLSCFLAPRIQRYLCCEEQLPGFWSS